MPIQVVADDSGCKGQGENIVFAGLIGPAEWWADFSDKWDACLHETPNLSYFKMQHAAHRTGPFRGFTKKMRDEKLVALVRVLNEHPFVALHLTVDLAAHEEFHWQFSERDPSALMSNSKRLSNERRRTLSIANNPYFFVYKSFLSLACYHLWETGHKEQFEFIVDEHPSLGTRTKQWYPVLRSVMPQPFYFMMPVEPVSRSDTDFLPLQAADMIAWLQLAENTQKGHEFGWLGEHFTAVTQSHRCAHVTPEFFDLAHQRTNAARADGGLPIEAMIEMARLEGAPIPGPGEQWPKQK